MRLLFQGEYGESCILVDVLAVAGTPRNECIQPHGIVHVRSEIGGFGRARAVFLILRRLRYSPTVPNSFVSIPEVMRGLLRCYRTGMQSVICDVSPLQNILNHCIDRLTHNNRVANNPSLRLFGSKPKRKAVVMLHLEASHCKGYVLIR